MKLTTAVGERSVAAPVAQVALDKAAAAGSSAAAVVAPDNTLVGAQTERVQAAQAQLAQMPAVDAQRVAEIKAALARGEIGFNPQKVASLIVRHHGGRG